LSEECLRSNAEARERNMTYGGKPKVGVRIIWAAWLLLFLGVDALGGDPPVTFADLDGSVIELKVLRQQRIARQGREFSHQFQSDWKIEIGPDDRILLTFTPTAYTPQGTRTGKSHYGYFKLEQPRQVTTSGGGEGVWLFEEGKLTFFRTFRGGALKLVVSLSPGTDGLACSVGETFMREEGVRGIVLESAIDGVPVTVLSAKQISGDCRHEATGGQRNTMKTAPVRYLLAAMVFSLPPGAAVAQSVPSQTGCFEIVAARSESHPSGSILLNRCSGQTWMLVQAYPSPAGGTAVYRWSAIASDATAEPRPSAGAPVATTSDKCFMFQGRRFCE
jgi:hypothetical protein